MKNGKLVPLALTMLGFALLMSGCPQPNGGEKKTLTPTYGISLSHTEYAYYTPTGDDFASKNVRITVTNTGNQPTGSLQVRLNYEDEEAYAGLGYFALAFGEEEPDDPEDISIPSIAAGQTAQFTLAIDPEEILKTMPDRIIAEITVGNNKTGVKSIPLTYGAFDFTSLDDLTFEDSGGQELSRLEIDGQTGVYAQSDSTGDDLEWFSSNAAAAVIDKDSGELTLTGSGVTFIGLIDWETMSLTGKKTYIFPQNYQAPQVTAIALDGDAPKELILTYSAELSSASGIAGFTLTGSTTGLSITGGVVDSFDEHDFILTLNKVPAQSELDALVLSYAYPASGGVIDQFDTPVMATLNDDADNPDTTITVTHEEKFAKQPVATSAVIDGAASKTTVVITFDQPVTATTSAGFTITGSSMATSFTNAVTIDSDDSTKLKLTLNQKPYYDEISALTLAYAAAQGTVKNANNDHASLALADITSLSITVNGFTAEADGLPTLSGVFIDAKKNASTGMQDEAASAENAKKVYITFNKAVQATNSGGFTISGSSTALYFESAVSITTITTTNDTVVLTLNDWPSASESGTVKLSYNISLGNVKDTNDGAVQSFTEQTIEFRNYSTMGNNADIIKPWLVSATVENDTPSVVRVVFSEPVTADAAKFLVKVNTTPKTNIADLTNTTGLPVMDFSAKTRTIANAAAVGGSSPSATWDLTMTTPAGFGEILRLATGTSATNNSDAVSNNLPTYTPCDGAAYDAANNLLPQIPQFIIRNLVQRTKGDFETAAGLYRNGIGVEAVNDGSGGQLYQNAMNLLKTSGSYPQAGEIITIVIASNQTYTAANTFTSIHVPTSLQSNPPTIILTTPTGNTTDYTITVTGNEHGMVLRNGLTLVMDEHVIMKHDTTTNNFPFLSVNDGGKFILNGGALKDNTLIATTNDHAYRGGAIRGGGGSYGCYFVINSGEISGNTVNMNIAEGNSHGGAGAIYMYQYAAFVMHGGTIARNTFNYTYSTAAATAKAGAIADMTSSSATYHANSSFFMTGGIISGNSVSGASNGVSSGGVVVSGAFQKNGGTIYGDDAGDAALRNNNTMTGSGIVKAKSVAVINQATANPDPTASIGAGTESDPTRPAAVVRNGTTGPNDSLFVASYKTAKANAGINTVPDWAKSFWDDTPTP